MSGWEAVARALVRDAEFEDLLPYSSDDVARFLELGEPAFGHVRFEAVPSEGRYVCDVSAYIPGRSRFMVWQGIEMLDGRVGLPDYLLRLPAVTRTQLENVLTRAWEIGREKAGGEMGMMTLRLAADCPIPMGGSEFIVPGTASCSSYVAHARRYLFASEFCAGRSALDVGCGSGYGARILASEARSCRAVDISQEAVEFARSAYSAPNLKFMQADAGKLPSDDAFDTVVCLEVLQHMDEPGMGECLAEMVRVLEPNGRLVVSIPNRQLREKTGVRQCFEPYRDEFYLMLARHFGSENVRLFGQRPWDGGVSLADECAIAEKVSDEDAAFIAVCRRPGDATEFRVFPAVKYKASIILPVHNEAARTRACLEAIAETAGDDMAYEVVVINNCSTDSTRELLAALEGDVRVITNSIEIGFGAACNQGAEAATGEHLVFLNQHVIPQPGWLQSLVKTADGDPDIGVVGPMVLAPDGGVQHTGFCFADNCAPKPAYQGLPLDHASVSAPREMQAVGRTCMLVKAWLFHEIGGFAGSRFVHYEDADLCLRAREAGAKVVYWPDARVADHESPADANSREIQLARRITFQAFLKRWKGRLICDAAEFRRSCADQARTVEKVPVVWHGLVFDPSGYADEARNFIFAMDGRWPLAVETLRVGNKSADLSREALDCLSRLSEALFDVPAVHVWHIQPHFFQVIPDGYMTVGRTMFETDRIPESWVEPCNMMDEIWVPCEFNMETFARSGVRPEKLVKIPGAIDLWLFDPGLQPLDIPARKGFNFLCNLDWRPGKGWDVLLKAYCAEFKPSDDVALLIKAYAAGGKTASMIHEDAKAFLQSIGHKWGRTPEIVFVDGVLPAEDMPRLYSAADAYVLPTRGEGWGRTQMEAMAMELPTISTRWSGSMDFMNDDNSFLVDCDVVDVPESAFRDIPSYRGHKWAQPSVEHLRQLMRRVFEDRTHAREVGMRARADLESKYTRERVADLIIQHLRKITAEGR